MVLGLFPGDLQIRWSPVLPRHFPYKGGSSNKIFKVFGGRAGGLWAVGSREIAYIKDGVVTSDFQLDGFSSFQNVSEDPDGSLWVVRAAANISDSALCHVTERAVKCFGKAEGVPISPIDSILADGKGGFWLGGQTSLVHWRDGASETYPIEALKSNVGQHGVVSVALGPDGTVWVGMLAEGPGLGLGQLKEGVVKPFVTPTFDGSKVEVFAMTFDRDGNLWVASRGKGLYRIHGDVVDHYGRTDGLSSDSVNLLFEDREGILWAGTSNGIDSFRDPRVTTFSSSEGLGKDAASGVLASRDGSIWVANDGSLDRIANGSISSLRTGAGLPGHQVASLLEDRAGNLWVGVDDSLYVLKDGRFRPIAGPDHKPLGLVVGITEDIDGNIWAACAGNPRKLVRIRDFEVREEFPTSQVPAARTLAPDPQGGIWIATTTGDLARFRNGAVEKFALNLKGNPVLRRIVVKADGSVLAASEDGLVGLRRGKVQRMTTENSLPCSAVFSFVEDKEKRWWLYTDCGVLELADSELQRWWSDPGALVQTRIYDRLDGAQPNAPYFNSAAYSPDGRVWFANGQVVQMVDPSTLSRKALPAPTYIESVIVDRREFAASGNLGLAPHPRDLQIDYTSPTFTVPQKVKFRYRLDSYDSDWHDAGTRRQAFYTDLPPGNYTFRVIAANSDGVWNETPTTLDFSIAPAYYQTNWFRALCAMLLLLLAWAGYQLRIRRLHRQFEMTLDARVAERTRIARDLHDTLLQSFHGLLLRFQTAFNLLPDRPAESKQVLASAIDQAAEAITEGRDAVQGLRTSATEMNDLADSICVRSAKSWRTRTAEAVFAGRGARHAAGAASDRARRGLPHRRRGTAQRLPPCQCEADRGRAALRRAAASGAGARRRQGHRPGGLARGGAGRAFRVGRDAGAREARRRQAHRLERARCGNRGGIEHSRRRTRTVALHRPDRGSLRRSSGQAILAIHERRSPTHPDSLCRRSPDRAAGHRRAARRGAGHGPRGRSGERTRGDSAVPRAPSGRHAHGSADARDGRARRDRRDPRRVS